MKETQLCEGTIAGCVTRVDQECLDGGLLSERVAGYFESLTDCLSPRDGSSL